MKRAPGDSSGWRTKMPSTGSWRGARRRRQLPEAGLAGVGTEGDEAGGGVVAEGEVELAALGDGVGDGTRRRRAAHGERETGAADERDRRGGEEPEADVSPGASYWYW